MKTMNLVDAFFLLSFIPFILSAGHEEHNSNYAYGMNEEFVEHMKDPFMVDEVVSLAINGTDLSTDILT